MICGVGRGEGRVMGLSSFPDFWFKPQVVINPTDKWRFVGHDNKFCLVFI